MTLNDLWTRFKVADSINAAKVAKYNLVMTPTPCRVVGCIISIRPTYSLVHLIPYLLTYSKTTIMGLPYGEEIMIVGTCGDSTQL